MSHNLVKILPFVLLLIAPSSVRAVLVPTGLIAGDTYQLAFLTDGTRDAIPTSIGSYNTFVQDQASMNSSLTGTDQGVLWFVIGSTFSSDGSGDARVNALVSAPVYLLDGITKIADGFTDMWDGDIDNPINVNQFGSSVSSPDPIFTGSNADGTKSFPIPSAQRFLGSSSTVQIGLPGVATSSWISDPGTSLNSDLRSFYALSGLLTVVPEPTAASLIASGLLAVLWRRRRAPQH